MQKKKCLHQTILEVPKVKILCRPVHFILMSTTELNALTYIVHFNIGAGKSETKYNYFICFGDNDDHFELLKLGIPSGISKNFNLLCIINLNL